MNGNAKQYFMEKIEELEKIFNRRRILKEMISLQEMANCRPSKTGLPMNIWIDETESYKNGKHAKRIKFQINKNQKFQPQNTCPMTLDGNIPPKVWNKVKNNKDFDLEQKEKDAVSNFVINNSYALDKVADQLLWLDDFWEIFIKGGNQATAEEIKNLKEKTDHYVSKHQDS